MSNKQRRHFGDRKDGRLLRELDAMHYIMPIIYPNRCDNEAYISERIDLTNINAYLEKKNQGEDFPYTAFHVIAAALIKTLTLRPKMNRFIANKNVYQRDEVSLAFIVKKQFADNGEEGLAFIHAGGDYTLPKLHEEIRAQVTNCRAGDAEQTDDTSDSMDILNKMPRFLSKFFLWLFTVLDKHGKCPDFLISNDPFYASVLISNLGSIKLKCGYHHLTNWGTCSVFCIIGEKKLSPIFAPDGSYVMHETLDIGLTIDERLADGYYYSKSIRLLKHLLENPELLELPAEQEIEY